MFGYGGPPKYHCEKIISTLFEYFGWKLKLNPDEYGYYQRVSISKINPSAKEIITLHEIAAFFNDTYFNEQLHSPEIKFFFSNGFSHLSQLTQENCCRLFILAKNLEKDSPLYPIASPSYPVAVTVAPIELKPQHNYALMLGMNY